MSSLRRVELRPHLHSNGLGTRVVHTTVPERIQLLLFLLPLLLPLQLLPAFYTTNNIILCSSSSYYSCF